jgi:CRP-like cAMP-binding protein
MHQLLLQQFRSFSALTSEEEQAIVDSLDVKEPRQGAYLLREGEGPEDTYFVIKGCVREYYLVEGEERTSNFFTEGQWVISLPGGESASSRSLNRVCMEDCQLVVGNEEKAAALFRLHPRFETLSRKVMERMMAEQQARLASYLTDTPEQRYRKLLATRADIVQRVPQYHIASYVGVKPESLSRIRKRMAEEKE